MKKFDINNLDFNKMDGLIPAIIQDVLTKEVLMLGYMNFESLNKTIESGFVTFFSRSRQTLWKKGETSGNVLKVVEIFEDCDKDCLLITAKPKGGTCHTGDYSCFGVKEELKNSDFLFELFSLLKERKEKMPKGSYTTSLFESGLDRILQKVGEESIEVVLAAKNESKSRLKEELSDLLYHLWVMIAYKDVELTDVIKELQKRRRSGEN